MNRIGSTNPAGDRDRRPELRPVRPAPARGPKPRGIRPSRAFIISLASHVLLLGGATVLARPHFKVPEPIPSIPVSLVGMPAPARALMERARGGGGAPKEVVPPRKPEAKKPEQPKPQPKPVTKETKPKESTLKSVRPGAASTKPDEKPQRDLPKRGGADTLQTVRTDLPAIGNLHGSMQMQIEGQELPYSYYLGIIQDKIASLWEPAAALESEGREIVTTVWFRIERDGQVSSYHIEEPSGSALYDQSAMRALVRAAPLPPLPEGYTGDHLIIHLSFVYTP